jgi:hypothetical protein
VSSVLVIVASGFYIVHREHRLRVRNRAAIDVEVEALGKKTLICFGRVA